MIDKVEKNVFEKIFGQVSSLIEEAQKSIQKEITLKRNSLKILLKEELPIAAVIQTRMRNIANFRFRKYSKRETSSNLFKF